MKIAWLLAGVLISTPGTAAQFWCVGQDGSTSKTSDPSKCRTMIALPEEGAPSSEPPAASAASTPPAVAPRTAPSATAPARAVPLRRIANPACRDPDSKVRRDVLASLAKRHKGSYSLQEILLDANMDGYHNVCRIQIIPELVPTLEKLYERHYPNYNLMWILLQNELRAYERLHGSK